MASERRETRKGAVLEVYEELKRQLASGRWPPGAHLREEAIAAMMGVSRTPVREAVRKLAAEDWITLVQNQGAFVATWSQADVEEVMSLRALLESRAAHYAALNASPEAVASLKEACESALRLLDSGEDATEPEIGRLNNRFHRILLEASCQRRTASIMANLIELPIKIRYFRLLTPEDMRHSLLEHLRIAEAVAVRDPAWAASLMQAHIQGGKAIFLARLEQAGLQEPPTPAVAPLQHD